MHALGADLVHCELSPASCLQFPASLPMRSQVRWIMYTLVTSGGSWLWIDNMRWQVVCARADAISAKGIVLAKHNRGLVADFFLGSVTSYCSENARQAVIVFQ